ncbi:hypothetical protein [Natrinema salinisoli]|uniref:hypothetical protein n=1 Tax=Natrinema salinisoli TaxID=2878535 RepID=UPI001CF03F43|nr:hypothetical protein [Natrinema salinisoli]
MAASPLVLPMDVFWQVLAFTIIVTVIAPKRVVAPYLFTALMGFAVSAASVIPYSDEAGLALINSQVLFPLIPAGIYLVRGFFEKDDRPHVVFQIASLLSPVSGIDPGTADQPQATPQEPVQEPQGQQHGGGGQQQSGGGYTVVPDPEQVDADAAPDGESIEDLVNEIDEHRE